MVKIKVHPTEASEASESILISAFKPLLVITRLLGLNNKCRVYDVILVLVWMCVYTAGAAVSFLNINEIYSQHGSIILTIIESLQLLGGYLLILFYLLYAFSTNKTLTKIFQLLNDQDIHLTSVNFHIVYRSIFIKLIVQLLVSSVIIFCLMIIYIYSRFTLNNLLTLTIIFYLTRFAPITILWFMVILVLNITTETRRRLKVINDFAKKQLETYQYVSERHLCLISIIYESMYEIYDKLNNNFELLNIIQIGNCFISITSKIFFIFTTLTDLDNATIFDALAVPHLIILMCPVIVLSTTTQNNIEECKVSNKILQNFLTGANMDNPRISSHQIELAEIIIRQMQHQRIRYTSFSFFEIEMSLIFMVVGAVTTYLVILLQFNIGT